MSKTFVKNLLKISRTLLYLPQSAYRSIYYKFSNKRTILFNMLRRNHFALIAPVYHHLKKDARLDICFTSSKPLDPDIKEILIEAGVPKEHYLTVKQACWKRWDMYIDVDYTFAWIARPTNMVQMFHGNAGKTKGDGRNFSLSPTLKQYDWLFCLSKNHINYLHEAGIPKHKNSTLLIGFVKLDSMVDGSVNRNEVLKSYGADPAKMTVLYAPSFNLNLSLQQIGCKLIETLSGRNWTLLVKLHPCSFTKQFQAGNTGKGWQEYLDGLHKKGSLIHVTDQTTSRYLTCADVLITDFGSTLTEYMILGRPILYYDTPEANQIISFPGTLQKIRSAVYSFQTPQQAFELINQPGWPEKPDSKNARNEILQERFYDIGHAADRAVAAVYKILKLPQEIRLL